MHTRHHHDRFIIDAVEKLIRKPRKQHPPGFSMNHGISGGMRTDIVQRGSNSGQKLLTQASALLLVPQKCRLDIPSSGGANYGRHHGRRCRILPRTSSQGIPTGPSRSRSSSRRSNSSRWAPVSGNASGFAERLSQSSSSSRNRSSRLRLAISMDAMPPL